MKRKELLMGIILDNKLNLKMHIDTLHKNLVKISCPIKNFHLC